MTSQIVETALSLGLYKCRNVTRESTVSAKIKQCRYTHAPRFVCTHLDIKGKAN